MSREEIFPLVDAAGNVIGQATRTYCHSGAKPLHPVVHLQVFNSKGELYLQQRAWNKDIQPGKWDTAVGGHVDYGEHIEDALRREAREELGIHTFSPKEIICYQYESEIEKELVYSYSAIIDHPLIPDPSELAGGRFWTGSEIRTNLGKNKFTPNFEYEFRIISDMNLI